MVAGACILFETYAIRKPLNGLAYASVHFCNIAGQLDLVGVGACKLENSGVDKEKERRELRILVEQIKSDSGCVLVLGPRIAVRAEDPARRPLDRRSL